MPVHAAWRTTRITNGSSLMHIHVNGLRTPSGGPQMQNERANSTSTESSASSTIPSIDAVCPPEIFNQIIQDYLDSMYPILPFFHIPTFKKNLADGLHSRDSSFFCFIISLCAAVSGMQPKRFLHYRNMSPAFESSYPTLLDFIKRVHLVVQKTREPDMHENMTMTSWALAYTLFMSHACIGQSSSCRIYKAEATAIVLDMACHRLGAYADINPIETQVRKKAFWITVASHICLRITGESLDTLNDRTIFDQADTENLHVLPFDDEYITAEHVTIPPPGELQVAFAFCKATEMIRTMAAIWKDPTQPKVTTSTQHSHQFSDTIGSCSCGKLIETAPPLLIFQDRLRKVRACILNLPKQLGAMYRPPSSLGLRDMQIEIMRVNLHIQHMWMQHVLIDRLELASMMMTESEGGLGPKKIWEMRDDVYLQLLAILDGVTEDSLAPNGHALVLMIRQVAASLLDFPPNGDEVQMEISRQAQTYLKHFTVALSRLDSNYIHGQVIDMNILKQQHMAPMTYEGVDGPAT
ncbi:hypothetical protein ACEPPN_008286 [Leptodophora sp. 'Broadleaf-Isolate-01']